MQDAIWATYTPGQERRKDPTEEYLDAADAAVAYVAQIDAQPEQGQFL